jgi:hypothetical protein
MHDEPIFSAPLAPHTADIAELLAADRWDVAAHVHELAAGQASETDLWMARALFDAPWEQVSPEQVSPGTPVRHTADVAELLAAGHRNAALAMHEAYVMAEFEREDAGASNANMVDIWMAGLLLIADAARRDMGLDLPV